MRFMIIVRASRAIIPYLLERCLGLHGDTARRIGPVLSQGGELAFVLFAVGTIQGMIGEPLVHLLKLAVTLSMAAPSFALLIDEAASRASTPEPPESRLGGVKQLAAIGNFDMKNDPASIALKGYQAYADKDRDAIEAVIADDFHCMVPSARCC